MKNICIYIFISLLFMPASICAVEYSKQYEECMDKSEGITSVMLDCIADETNNKDKLLNSNYKKIMLMLDKEKKLELKKSQRLWIKYRNAKCNFLIGLSGGTIDSLNATNCFLDMTAVRANELDDLMME